MGFQTITHMVDTHTRAGSPRDQRTTTGPFQGWCNRRLVFNSPNCGFLCKFGCPLLILGAAVPPASPSTTCLLRGATAGPAVVCLSRSMQKMKTRCLSLLSGSSLPAQSRAVSPKRRSLHSIGTLLCRYPPLHKQRVRMGFPTRTGD
jgi:hypothetical protein